MHLSPGTGFAGYTIIRLLGSGGMGQVYLAQHPRLPRQDALKVLRADVSDDGEFRERFIQEADLAASLSHPNIVTVHDRGEYDEQLWIATAYVDGTDASQMMREQYPAGVPIDQVLTIVTGIAAALDYAHDRGLLHRDVKPANILLSEPDKDGHRRIFLADFGIARPIADASGLTATNLTVGTVAYAAPEQLMGDDLDGRADQYALAATAHHLLTGSPLYEGTNPVAVISRHLTTPAPALSDHRPDLAPLDGALFTALSKDRTGRYDTCTAFAQALSDAAGLSPTRAALPQVAQTIAAQNYRALIDQPATPVPQSTTRRRPLIALAAAAAAVALVVAGGYFVVARPGANDSPVSASAPADGTTIKSASAPGADRKEGSDVAGKPAHKVEVSFNQIGDSLNVRLHNPNPDVGLVRSPFELALLDDNGAIVANLGDEGLPGTEVSTIYQLPPNGDFGFSSLSAPQGKTVASVELTVTGKWVEWDTVDPAQVTITDAAVLPDSGSSYSGPSVTGRLSLDKNGPLNAIIMAFIKTPAGTVISTAFSDCVQTGQPRAFEAKSFNAARGPYELESVVAYATSVNGAGTSYTPTC
jgi:serine/threonine protein kinase